MMKKILVETIRIHSINCFILTCLPSGFRNIFKKSFRAIYLKIEYSKVFLMVLYIFIFQKNVVHA